MQGNNGSGIHAGGQRGEAWQAEVERYTLELVRINSQSPGPGENAVAEKILELLRADDAEGRLADAYDEIGLDALPDDAPYHRQNAYAFVRGASPQTIVLLGHFDVVGVDDYGALRDFAFDPEALSQGEALARLIAITPGLGDDLAAHPGDWLLGRGVVDMKSGVAANIAVLRRIVALKRAGRLPISALLLATPDEENESAGVLQGVRLLLRLREQHILDYLGAINTDYTTALYPGDLHR
ncbi:MAG: M20/M25/M40 family metallo-hydrolase, partial [Ktedonobacterales bacterium]